MRMPRNPYSLGAQFRYHKDDTRDTCLHCPLPDCDDQSDFCPLKQRRMAAVIDKAQEVDVRGIVPLNARVCDAMA